VKKKQTNSSQSEQKLNSNDPWATLQMQLGLLTSPIEHEQILVVSAVTPKETEKEQEISKINMEESSNENENQTQILEEETKAVSITIQVPLHIDDAALETDNEVKIPIESAKKNGAENETSFLDFGDLSDPGIPRFAFSKPRESQAQTEKLPEPVTNIEVANNDFSSENKTNNNDALQTSFAESENHRSELENAETFDPLATEELPTSLWQPRKIVATPPQPPKIASLSDKLPLKSTESPTGQPLADAPPSSYKQHREPSRSDNKREKFAPSGFEFSEDVEIERPSRGSRPSSQRQHPSPRKPYVENANASFDAEETAKPEEFAAHPQPQYQPRDSRPQRFSKNRKSSERMSSEQTTYRNYEEPEDRDFSYDNEIQDIPANTQRENIPQKRARDRGRTATEPRVERERAVAESRVERNLERSTISSPTTPPAPQKLIVPGWESAVCGIIEKNMARRNNLSQQSAAAVPFKNPHSNNRPKKRS
jgi:hypothetical protein